MSDGEICKSTSLNPLNAELYPIRHLLALVGVRHIVHVSRIRVNSVLLSGGYQTAPHLQEAPKNFFKYSSYVIYFTATVMCVRYAHLTDLKGLQNTFFFSAAVCKGHAN